MQTEGIKYTGSKNKIIPIILELVKPLKIKTVLDGFSGTTRVAQAFKKSGYIVHANDIAVWSKVFGECYLLNKKPKEHYQPMIDYLNNLPGKYGWFSQHYGGEVNNGISIQKDGKKRMWQIHNTLKLDAIRPEIDIIAKDNVERSVLLTSLIIAMDKVDSSVGHQVSYLEEWSPRSYKTMRMEAPSLITDNKEHYVYQQDIFDLIKTLMVDLAYYDPPYGSSNELMPPSRVRYASYYHIWKTICLNDKPGLTGAANRRKDVGDRESASLFEEFRKNNKGQYIVIAVIERLLRLTKAKHIILSYSNSGRATLKSIIEILKSLGFEYQIIEMDYKRNVMANMTWTNEWINNNGEPIKNKEYLFLINKTKLVKDTKDFEVRRVNMSRPEEVNQQILHFY